MMIDITIPPAVTTYRIQVREALSGTTAIGPEGIIIGNSGPGHMVIVEHCPVNAFIQKLAQVVGARRGRFHIFVYLPNSTSQATLHLWTIQLQDNHLPSWYHHQQRKWDQLPVSIIFGDNRTPTVEYLKSDDIGVY